MQLIILSAAHLFFSCGVINVDKKGLDENYLLELTTSLQAKDFSVFDKSYEIITQKEDFYKIKKEIEKKKGFVTYSSLEWRANNMINLDQNKSKSLIELLKKLDDLDDVQNIYTNINLEGISL